MKEKDNFRFTDNDKKMFEFIFKYKCLNYNQLMFFTDLHYVYLRTRMNLFMKHKLVSSITYDSKAYWFLERKGLGYINAFITDVRPSYSIIKHTSKVVDVAIYFKRKLPNYTFQSEREFLQESGFRMGRNSKNAVSDLIIYNEKGDLIYAVEVELTRKAKHLFTKKVKQLYSTYLQHNDTARMLWVVPNKYKNIEERLLEINGIQKRDYEILSLENVMETLEEQKS